MSEPDPYATPQSLGEIPPAPPASELGELVKSWEKLRLKYNAILILPGIAVLLIWHLNAGMPLLAVLILGAITGIAANAAFLLGPLAELYCRSLWFGGQPAPSVRYFLFVSGIIFSLLVMIFAAFLGLAEHWMSSGD